MKKRLLVALMAVMLVLTFAATAMAASDYSIGSRTKITIRSTDTPTVYISFDITNESSEAINPGSGEVKLYSESGALLYTGSVYCKPSTLQPGQTGYCMMKVPFSKFSDSSADGVDKYEISFDPYSGYTTYTVAPNTATLGVTSADYDQYNGYPLTVSITNNTDTAYDDFDVIGVIYNAKGEVLYVTENRYVYNRIPSGSTILVNTYVPKEIMELIIDQRPGYTYEAFVYVPSK